MPLNDRQIKNAKPKEKDYKLTDGKGLYLLITPAGGKLWRLKYRIAGKEKTNVAEKIRQWLGAIYHYAAMLEITDRNPAGVLQGVIHRPPVKHMPALPAAELETFYSRLKAAHIAHSNRIAIMLLMLTFTRSNELRGAQWQEMDFQAAIWHIPAHRMKMNRPHAVPLADWTLELLHELQAITGSSPFLFPSRTKLDSYISENTLGKIIHNMGYKGIATPHGFRSLASSTLNEQGFNPAGHRAATCPRTGKRRSQSLQPRRLLARAR